MLSERSYNYPVKLDRAIRCMIACKKNIEEARHLEYDESETIYKENYRIYD